MYISIFSQPFSVVLKNISHSEWSVWDINLIDQTTSTNLKTPAYTGYPPQKKENWLYLNASFQNKMSLQRSIL